MVYRGESVNLSCPGASEFGSAYWHKQKYKEGVSPLFKTTIASYLSETDKDDRIQVSPLYEARGVTMSNTDAHLHFPEIQLSDEGVYICRLNAFLHVIELEVWGRVFVLFISAVHKASVHKSGRSPSRASSVSNR